MRSSAFPFLFFPEMSRIYQRVSQLFRSSQEQQPRVALWTDPNPRDDLAFDDDEEAEEASDDFEDEDEIGEVLDEYMAFSAGGVLCSRPTPNSAFKPVAGGKLGDHLLQLVESTCTLKNPPQPDPKSRKKVPTTTVKYELRVVDRSSGEVLIDSDVKDCQGQLTYSTGGVSAIMWAIYHDGIHLHVGFQLRSYPGLPAATICVHFIKIFQSAVYNAYTGSKLQSRDVVEDAPVKATGGEVKLPTIDDQSEGLYAAAGAAQEMPLPMDIEGEDEDMTGPVRGVVRDLDGDAIAANPQADEWFAFDDNAHTQSYTGNGFNHCFADSTQFNRAIVLHSEGKDKPVQIQAHRYDENGMTGERSQFELQTTSGKRGTKGLALDPKSALLASTDRKLMIVNGVEIGRAHV